MRTAKIKLGTLGTLLACLAALPAASALAGDRDRHDRDDHRGPVYRHHDDDRGGFSVKIGPSRPVTVQRWVGGRYETRTEQVLVEPGHYVTRTEQVLVEPGRWEERCIPAVEEIRRDHRGRTYRVIVVPARTVRVWIEPCYQTRTIRVWCPPRYGTRTVGVWVPGCYVTEAAPWRSGVSLGALFRW